MEWVQTTGKTLEEARERILDQLGVAEEDADIEVLEQPKSGLFGLIRGEARVRGRVRPAEVRPKQDRRRGRGRAGGGRGESAADAGADDTDDAAASPTAKTPASGRSRGGRSPKAEGNSSNGRTAKMNQDAQDRDTVDVDPEDVGRAAVAFVSGVVEAFGRSATVEFRRDGEEIEVRADGQDLGRLVGPGGRTLLALQDLTRVVAQRRLGDHVTRLRVDVAGYRERRQKALEKFVAEVAASVVETGIPRSLEAMPSADRKIVHDVLTDIEGVSSRSEGEDPHRRVVIAPA